MVTVPLRTPMGNIPAEADEIIGSFAVVNLSQYMNERTVYFGISHVQSGWGFASFSDKDVAIRFAQHLNEALPNWDDIYRRVDAGMKMDDMLEADVLVTLYWRSFHDSHSIIPLQCADYLPREIIEEVENHRAGMFGDAN